MSAIVLRPCVRGVLVLGKAILSGTQLRSRKIDQREPSLTVLLADGNSPPSRLIDRAETGCICPLRSGLTSFSAHLDLNALVVAVGTSSMRLVTRQYTLDS